MEEGEGQSRVMEGVRWPCRSVRKDTRKTSCREQLLLLVSFVCLNQCTHFINTSSHRNTSLFVFLQSADHCQLHCVMHWEGQRPQSVCLGSISMLIHGGHLMNLSSSWVCRREAYFDNLTFWVLVCWEDLPKLGHICRDGGGDFSTDLGGNETSACLFRWQSGCVLVGSAAVGEGAIIGLSLNVTSLVLSDDPALSKNCCPCRTLRRKDYNRVLSLTFWVFSDGEAQIMLRTVCAFKWLFSTSLVQPAWFSFFTQSCLSPPQKTRF